MTRDILFRGKTVDTEEWVYGYYIKDDLTEYIIVIENNTSTSYKVIPESVGQFTGVSDREGKSVFENDIVCFGTFDKDSFLNKVVYFDYEGYPAFDVLKEFNSVDGNLLHEYMSEGSVMVVGNSYDDPELLYRNGYDWSESLSRSLIEDHWDFYGYSDSDLKDNTN